MTRSYKAMELWGTAGGFGRASLIWLAVMLLASCAGASSDGSADNTIEATPTVETVTPPTAPSLAKTATPTPEAPAIQPLDEAFLAAAVDKIVVTDGTFLITVLDQDGSTVEASLGTDRQGRSPTASDLFRIGSITKVFTALVTLTLVDDGMVDLDAPAADYVTRVPVPDRVLVRDLLGHRSGIFDTTSVEGFIPQLLIDQGRRWSPEEQLELIADQAPVSPPGIAFNYSNSNYVILGVLIEEVTGQSYHEVVRSRIIDPLGMTSTYLAGFENGDAPFDPYVNSSVTEGDQQYDFTSIATAAWAAGAMVSSAEDLHILFSAIFDGRVVSSDLVAEMTRGANYGFGVELRDSADGLVGHEGGIPGYSTFVRHSIDSGMTAFFALTDDGANPSPARRPILDALAQQAGP